MIYFITDGVYTKIGKSKTPLKRIQGLQTSNPTTLKFQYVFDVKDIYEKKLHDIFKDFKTTSNNEWFDLKEVSIKQYLHLVKHPSFIDLSLALFKANQFNNELFRGSEHTSEARTKIFKENYNIKTKKQKDFLKEKRLNLIKDIENHLQHNKTKRISYDPYVTKYGFTKAEISYYLKGARLSKLVFLHNESVG